MSNITSCDSGSFREDAAIKHRPQLTAAHHQFHSPTSLTSTTTNSNGSNANSQLPPPVKRKRNLPGNPDPNAEVIALSPNALMARNRFLCEICNKGFQRDQNLQLHRRGHNLPWKLKQRPTTEVRKRVYVCPEPSCVHHNPSRALGDLTGIKKHFSRKHGEKKWKCEKCSKRYAVQSDWKAHSKICGTREYKCDCGTIFSRRDSFITHRAFCDALAEENNKANNEGPYSNSQGQHQIPNPVSSLPINSNFNPQKGTPHYNHSDEIKHPISHLHQELLEFPAKAFNYMTGSVFARSLSSNSSCSSLQLGSNNSLSMLEEIEHQTGGGSAHMSATALLQKAALMGATMSNSPNSSGMAPSSLGHNSNHYYMNSGQADMSSSQYFGGNNNSFGMNNVDMFNAIMDQSKALSKMMEHNSRSSNNANNHGVLHSAMNGGPASKGSGGDVTTLDLLGIGAEEVVMLFYGANQAEKAETPLGQGNQK
ncbi:zinc finger protein GAI-ASSOCIATED FACTOR 1 [Neltuma alba]|uniref:zinc finger protein GAI-ASSOCIATED FACTOR 1 n=1 Tax=Neltuma alba TaxID=207710 RepID=UPI0010A4CAB0|nr:zinc finger protein GAI-ASSOCIATED FACTOR 1-like [Prosopis alba]